MEGQMSIFDYIQDDKCLHNDIACRMRPCAEAQGVRCCRDCDYNHNCLSKCHMKPKAPKKTIKIPEEHFITDEKLGLTVKDAVMCIKSNNCVGCKFEELAATHFCHDEAVDLLADHVSNLEIAMSFEEFQNVCNGMGGYFNNIKACSLKDKTPAKCWDDWQPCTLANCPYGNHEGQRTEFYRDETGKWQVRDAGGSE